MGCREFAPCASLAGRRAHRIAENQDDRYALARPWDGALSASIPAAEAHSLTAQGDSNEALACLSFRVRGRHGFGLCDLVQHVAMHDPVRIAGEPDVADAIVSLTGENRRQRGTAQMPKMGAGFE
jgi:hypothetical protein